jgi:hypothetical protein
MQIVERAEKLIALAVDPGAAVEEARTAAHAACRTIYANKLRLVAPQGDASPAAPTPQPPTPHRRRGRVGDRLIIESKFGGRCGWCGRNYKTGDFVAWARDRGALHPDCAEEEVAVA